MNILFCLTVAAAIGFLIMSERFKDGVIIKSGMILVALGYVGAASLISEGETDMMRPLYCIGLGVLICIIGLALRAYYTNGMCRRFSDWMTS
jgi:hypothetical protein